MSKIKIICDRSPNTGEWIPWVVRVVEKGDGYGLRHCLTHNMDEPLVEFYDGRYPHTDLGQFVSRYYRCTLLAGRQCEGLCLDGGIPAWSLSRLACKAVIAWLKTCQQGVET